MSARVQAFKTRSWDGHVRAWCTVCSWHESGEGTETDKNAISRICGHAKKHTTLTGHEVRLNHTHQRGYQRIGESAPQGEDSTG